MLSTRTYSRTSCCLLKTWSTVSKFSLLPSPRLDTSWQGRGSNDVFGCFENGEVVLVSSVRASFSRPMGIITGRSECMDSLHLHSLVEAPTLILLSVIPRPLFFRSYRVNSDYSNQPNQLDLVAVFQLVPDPKSSSNHYQGGSFGTKQMSQPSLRPLHIFSTK